MAWTRWPNSSVHALRCATDLFTSPAGDDRPYRPQTNGKVERYQRTLRDEWGYAKAYRSKSARRAALTSWLHIYNHHRPHTALAGRPPITRVTNVPGQNI